MNIFFVTKVSMPNGMAATKRIVCYSKGLAEAGAKVEILVLNRTENIKNVHNNETNGTICNGCTFRYFSKSTIRHGNLIIRKYNDLKDYLHCFLYLLNNSSKDSIIFTYGDFIIIPFILILISKLCDSVISLILSFCIQKSVLPDKTERIFDFWDINGESLDMTLLCHCLQVSHHELNHFAFTLSKVMSTQEKTDC